MSRFLIVTFLASLALFAWAGWIQDSRWDGPLYAGARKQKDKATYIAEAKGECINNHVCGTYDLYTHVDNWSDPDGGWEAESFYGNFMDKVSTRKSQKKVKTYGANSSVSGVNVRYGYCSDYWSANASI